MTRWPCLPLLLTLLSPGSAASATPFRSTLGQVEHLIDQWRIEEAAAMLAPLLRSSPRHPKVLQLRGEILINQGKYRQAHDLLKGAIRGSRTSLPLKALRDLAGSTADMVKGYTSHRSPGGHFEIWTGKGKDELLVPFAAETLEATRVSLERDLGYAPREPVRVEIYPSPEDLARVSPLTITEIRRSGTIALCKFNRLMVVSPRALLRGYSWRDTLAHEYVHLVITRRWHNTVPIWLHEGLAKFFEARWRQPLGDVAPLSPAQEHLLASALRQRKLIRWEQMHPSMAKLPSQEATALAFAQVQTAVQFLVDQVHIAGLRRLLDMIRSGRTSWEAIRQVSGLNAREFSRRWKQQLGTRNLRLLPDLVPPRLRFGKRPSHERRVAAMREGRARRFLHLAGLLRSRRLTRAAIIEYDKARKILGPRNDLVANHLARAYLEISSPAQAISALMPVLEYYPELSGPQVTMGIAYLRNREPAAAERHLRAALRINPFDPELHCGLADALKGRTADAARLHASLCAKLR